MKFTFLKTKIEKVCQEVSKLWKVDSSKKSMVCWFFEYF